MQSETHAAPISKGALWTGWVMSIVPGLFLLLDAVMKFVKPQPVVEATVRLGYPESVILPLGVVLLVCTVLYLVPQTAVLAQMYPAPAQDALDAYKKFLELNAGQTNDQYFIAASRARALERELKEKKR